MTDRRRRSESAGLRAYHRRRLELADILRSLLEVARARRDEDATAQARGLLARLAEDELRLAVVGQFSRGKSTLMNALLGAEYLPTGAAPMTSVVTTVRYDDQPSARVRRSGAALPMPIGLDELPAYVARLGTQRLTSPVVSVEVSVPAELLRNGVVFVDTPGIGSAVDLNTVTTRQFLPEADAVVFVTSYDSPLSADELAFLDDVRHHVTKLFYVVNKRDLVSAADATAVEGFVRDQLNGALDVETRRIFGMSALAGLTARTTGDHARWGASGLAELQTALIRFVSTEKSRVTLTSIADRAHRLATWQRRTLQLSRSGSTGDARTAILGRFDARLDEVLNQLAADAATTTTSVKPRLSHALTIKAASWNDELIRTLVDRLDHDGPLPTGGAVDGNGISTAHHWLTATAAEQAKRWFEQRVGETRELLIGLTVDDIDAMHRLARSPWTLAVEEAELTPHPADVYDPGWSATDLPTLAVAGPAWPPPPAPPRRRRHPKDWPTLRAQLVTALESSAQTYLAECVHRLTDAAPQWFAVLHGNLERATRQHADAARACLSTPADDAQLAQLDNALDQLHGLSASLGRGGPDAEPEPASRATIASSDTATRPSTDRCVLCAQLEKTLFDHLVNVQYELASSDARQHTHALAGGFCPLHTWQYANLTTPLGVAAAYARLAETTSAAVATVANARTREQLDDVLSSLTSQLAACPVCALLGDAGRRAARSLARKRDGASSKPPRLCLPHLVEFLHARPSLADSRAAAKELAAALHRVSEDMRGYALKREALRRDLLSGEEWRAPQTGLHLVAGRPPLAGPPVPPWVSTDGGLG